MYHQTFITFTTHTLIQNSTADGVSSNAHLPAVNPLPILKKVKEINLVPNKGLLFI